VVFRRQGPGLGRSIRVFASDPACDDWPAAMDWRKRSALRAAHRVRPWL